MESNPLVLSLFPGVGLLDMAFEEQGFCIVRGPDVLWGGNIKRFHPPMGKFDGVIGGPPCQAHTRYANLNRAIGKRVAQDLIPEFLRVVRETNPEWFLMENARFSPDVKVDGYKVQVLSLNARWFGSEQIRKRKFQFGSRSGLVIRPEIVALESSIVEPVVLASEGKSGRITVKHSGSTQKSTYHPRRELSRVCELQGLPSNFLDDSPFTLEAKYRVIGNGVPLPMGRAIAKAVRAALASLE